MERVNMYNNRNIRLINNVLALNRLFDVLENIVVDPVEIAIQRSLEEYELKKKDTNIEVDFYTYNTTEKKYDTCSICQEQYKEDSIVCILSCEHYFDKECLETWGKYKPECPMCKISIPTKETENNTQTNINQANNSEINSNEINYETADNTDNIFTIEDFLYSYGMVNSGIDLDNSNQNNIENNNQQTYTFASIYFYDRDEYTNNNENSTTDEEEEDNYTDEEEENQEQTN